MFCLPTTDGIEVETARRLGLLGRVMADRIRATIREERGLVYSAGVRSFASDTFPGFGYFSSSIDLDPDKVPAVVEAVQEITAKLHAEGVSADELERARLPVLTSIRDSARTNAYWLDSVLARAQSDPRVLDWARTRESFTAAISADELNELVQRFVNPDRVSRAITLPQ